MEVNCNIDIYNIIDQLKYQEKVLLFRYLFQDIQADDLGNIIFNNMDSGEIAVYYEADDMLRHFTKEELVDALLNNYSDKEINEYLQTLNYKLIDD